MKLVNLLDGREFALTKCSDRKGALPKRGVGSVPLIVNGTVVKTIVTSNLAWCGDPSLALEYLWFSVEGRAYFVTLGYGEKAAEWEGTEVSVEVGTGPKVPKRLVDGKFETVTERLETEAGRINKFRDTWAKRA